MSNEETALLQELRATPELFDAIRTSGVSELATQDRLRQQYSNELVRLAFSIQEGRDRAKGALPNAESLWLTRRSLEQSTAWEVAQHKARRFEKAEEVGCLVDVCCGIGVDTFALARLRQVRAIDSASQMTLCNQWNLEAWSDQSQLHDVEYVNTDATSVDLAGALVHADPDRRGEWDRATKRLEFYHPNLSWMQQLVATAKGGAIKVSPASNFMQKFPGCEIELVSLNGECKEATIWFGSLAGPTSFRATTLTSGESIAGDPLGAFPEHAAEPARFVFDPDPSLVRSGLLDAAAESHNLSRLDIADEYLTGDVIPKSSFFTAFEVVAVHSGNEKQLKRVLKPVAARNYEVKCRHVKVDTTAIQKRLPRGEGPVLTLFFLKVAGITRVVVTRRIKNTEECG